MKNSKRMRKRIQALIFVLVLIISAFGTTVFASDQCPKGGEHDYKVTIIKRATENQDGLRKYVCSKCGKTYTEPIPATGHVWGSWSVKTGATCTKSGKAVRRCIKHKDFTHYQYKIIPAKGHNWGDWIVDKSPTSSAEGLEHRCCKNDSSHIEYHLLPLISQNQVTAGTNIISNTALTTKDKSKTTAHSNIHSTCRSASNGADLAKAVPLGAADAAIAGANGVASIFFIMLLLPFIKVLLWVKKKHREAEENQ